MTSFSSLKRLGIKQKITFHSVALNDFRSTLKVLEEVEPNEIYNLAGQSSVGLSFEQPLETLESIANATRWFCVYKIFILKFPIINDHGKTNS